MHILVATHQYHPAVGGAERYITDLSVELAARDHHVQVLTSRSTDSCTWQTNTSDRVLKHANYHGVAVRRFRALPRRLLAWRLLDLGLRGYLSTSNPLYQPLLFFGNGPVLPGLFPYIVRHAAHFDLLHINHLHYAHAWTAAQAAALRGLPVVITPHLHIDQPQTYDIAYMRTLMRKSRVIIAQTGAERARLVQMGIEHVEVGGNGLRPHDFPTLDRTACRALFNIPPGAFVVLFLGRKVAYKGLQTCLQAFAVLRERCPQAYLLAVGPDTAESQQLLRPYHAWPTLVTRGLVSDVERLAALAACDVLAVPSTGEAFGIVYLEAWAYAKPVIGATIGAVASLIKDGEDGYLVKPDHPEELSERLIWLAEQPALARRMGERGYEKLQRRYTMSTITDIVEGAYRRVLRQQAAINPHPE